MVKNRLAGVFLFWLLVLCQPVAGADEVAMSCDAKKAALERELAYARQYGHTYRIQGLERALARVNAHCTNEGIRADLERDVASRALEVQERELELQEALRQADPGKIERREEKLAQARAELARARERLAAVPVAE